MRDDEKKILPVPKNKRKEQYWALLNEVIDPEVGIGIVDLGLVYKVDIGQNGLAEVYMTLTGPACPAGPELIEGVQESLMRMKGVKKVDVEIVWDPVWNHEFIDEDVRQMLFGL